VGAIVGGGAGVVAATSIDAIWIANRPLTPYVAPGHGGATAGVSGRF